MAKRKKGCGGSVVRLALVVAAVLLLGPWVWDHLVGGSAFDCEAAAASAHAASEGDCPADVFQAGGDAAWAADRIAELPERTSDEDKTTGVLYTADDESGQSIESGESGQAYSLVTDYLRPYPSTVILDRPKGAQARAGTWRPRPRR